MARRNFEGETGLDLGETCFTNRGEGGGVCRFPPVPLSPGLRGLWEVWRDTRSAVVLAGMDGVLTGRDLSQVRVAAEAHGEPFDPVFLERFAVLMDAERLQSEKRRPRKK
jgi:hypothetical protein